MYEEANAEFTAKAAKDTKETCESLSADDELWSLAFDSQQLQIIPLRSLRPLRFKNCAEKKAGAANGPGRLRCPVLLDVEVHVIDDE